MASYKNQTEMVFIDSIKQGIQQWTKHKPANCNSDHFSQSLVNIL